MFITFFQFILKVQKDNITFDSSNQKHEIRTSQTRIY
jgi:hypothetical protein